MPSKGITRKVLSVNSINPNVRDMRTGIYSLVVRRALEIERELEKGVPKQFSEVIRADVTDIQAMGQKPLTFIRQVLTLCVYPFLMNDDSFPPDVKKRANQILDDCGGRSIGAYTYSEGIDLVRNHIAQFITKRDGYPAKTDDVILTSGTREAFRSILNILNYPTNGRKIGVLVPVPRNPTFTAPLIEFGICQIDYYLEEDANWSVSMNELVTSVEAARKYCIPKAILIVNPGNPTGSVFTRKNMEDLIKFAVRQKLILLADEAYQFNVYGSEKFYSFKQIMMEMGQPYNSMELVSFLSGSKGILGESGLRTGYCELVNIHPDVIKVYKKSICVKMCPSVSGQIALDCLVCPPDPGDDSYHCFCQERTTLLQTLKEKAALISNALNSIDGIQCSKIVGAIFAFPRIFLPEKFIQKTKSSGLSPDVSYTMQLLEETGVCCLPGSDFGQLPGTYHFRLTILPDTRNLKKMLELLRNFNYKFLQEYI